MLMWIKTMFITTQLRFIFKVRLEKKTECTFQELYQLCECFLYFKSYENEIGFTWKWAVGICKRIVPSFAHLHVFVTMAQQCVCEFTYFVSWKITGLEYIMLFVVVVSSFNCMRWLPVTLIFSIPLSVCCLQF